MSLHMAPAFIAMTFVLSNLATGESKTSHLRGAFRPLPGNLDVAVVGGGIGGTYTAYRLLNSGRFSRAQIALFERSDHVGGRQDSPPIGCGSTENLSHEELKHMPRAELGGMMVRDTDTLMLGLAKELNIELGPFHFAPDSNPVYLRGIRSNLSSVREAQRTGEKLLYVDRSGAMVSEAQQGALPFVGPEPEDLQQEDGRDSSATNKGRGHLGQEQEDKDFATQEQQEEAASHGDHIDPCSPKNGEILMNREVPGTGKRTWELSPWTLSVDQGMSEEKIDLDDILDFGPSAAASRSSRNWGVSEDNQELRASVGIKDPVNAFRPLLGLQAFPLELRRRYEEVLGGQVFLNWELIRVERRTHQLFPYLITFEETVTSPCSGITVRTGRQETLAAARVVLAMPKAPLSKVDFVGFLPHQKGSLAGQVSRLLSAIRGVPLMKLHASFPSRWWQREGIGRSSNFQVGDFKSSTPVNSLFAWYPGTQARDPDGNYSKIPNQCKTVSGEDMGVLQMYSTQRPGDTWSGMMLQGQQVACTEVEEVNCGKCFNNHTGFFVTGSNPATNHVTQHLVNGWRSELAVMFGIDPSKIPDPTELKYKIWDAQDPVTGSDGVHFWEAGQEWWELYDQVLEVGGMGSRLHIIGEAFSFNWGWGEGALETAEYMLHEHMDIDLPTWLRRRDYCLAMPFYPFERKPLK